MASIQFSAEESRPQPAVIASFDLCGFSDFCNRDDASVLLPKFLSRLFAAMNNRLLGVFGDVHEHLEEFLGITADRQKVVKPHYMKFTGDGALMIWLAEGDGEFRQRFCTTVVCVMRNLQEHISASVPEWEKEWRVTGIPRRARFGITTGQVYPLANADLLSTEKEYVGYGINLAVRLQNHCPEVGFLVHESLHPQLDDLVKLEARGLKGCRDERVWAFRGDLKGLDPNCFQEKFRRRA